MKIRNGFVSNSSSSSFVIAKAYLNDDQIKGLRTGLVGIEMDTNSVRWGDSEMSWEEQGEYFIIETRLVKKQLRDLFEGLKINWEKGCSFES